jgi:prepilin-type N-terminal cleavage/methylation domain-containing protein
MDRIPAAGRATAAGNSKTRHGFNLTELIVVVAVIAILASLIVPARRNVRPAMRRTQCRNNLKQIVLALHHYKDEYHVFPPAYTVDDHGKPLHSWRTLLLPYLEEKALYKKIDLSKPWDDPANARIGETHLEIFTCPESRCPLNCTSYLAVVKPNSCLRPGKSRDAAEHSSEAGKTVLVIEVASKQAVPWMSTQDANEELVLSLEPENELPHQGGALAAFSDGTVQFLPAATPAELRRSMMSVTSN